jgi:hypothetical protein
MGKPFPGTALEHPDFLRASGAALLISLMLAVPAAAQKPKKPAPPKPKPAVGTIGTKQMAGTEGQVGITYSLKANDTTPQFNMTILSVSYLVGPVNIEGNTIAGRLAPAEQKIMAIHFIVQNPNKEDLELRSYHTASVLFQAVASDNKTYEPEDYVYDTFLHNPKLPLGKGLKRADLILKPGQKSETVIAFIPIPADVTVPKLVVKKGRVGTNEQVVRFDLRGKVKADFGIFADAANPETPKSETTAVSGTAYTLNNLEITLSDIKREPGPINGTDAEENKEFLTGNIQIKNVSSTERYFWVDCVPILTLVTEDGEKVKLESNFLKPSRTEEVTYSNGGPGEQRKGMFYFQIPKGAKPTSLIIYERNFPEFQSRRLVFSLENL